MPLVTAADLGVPEQFNAADYFVDRHAREGRAASIAIECGDERITYGGLQERVNRCGRALRDICEVRPEERVILLLPDGPAFVTAFWAAVKIGAVAVPVNTLLKTADYRYVLADSRARVLVVSDTLLPHVASIARDELPRLRHIVVVGQAPAGTLAFDDLLSQSAGELECERTGRDDQAFWLYSSGSTGVPKGCVHLHHDMVVSAELVAKQVFAITSADRCFSVAKLFFAYGLGNGMYFPFAVGATAILWPGPPGAAQVFDIIERYRPTLFYSVPTGYAMLLAHRSSGPTDFDLSSVRLAVSAGEALPKTVFDRFKQRFGLEILDAIGSTEALHMFIANRPGAVVAGSSGQIIPGFEARLLDADGRPVPAGDIGNLWIRGDSVCAGYWNKPTLTQETMVGGWLRTGDKYTIDASGYYWYAGRSDDMLKVGGQWVSPMEVENVLLSHPEVLECGVVGKEDGDRLVKPAAFIVLRTPADAAATSAADLQRFVRDRLAEYKRPRWVYFLSDLPKTATGKIQRFKLREMAAENNDS